MTRRSFCFRSLAGYSILAFSPWTVAQAATRSPLLCSGGLNFERFTAELDSVFQVDGDEHGVRALRLIRAESKKPSPRANSKATDAAFEKFSLVFAGDRASRLEQNSYTFTHPRLGRFEMFIVPVGSLDSAVQKYEAIFNRPQFHIQPDLNPI